MKKRKHSHRFKKAVVFLSKNRGLYVFTCFIVVVVIVGITLLANIGNKDFSVGDYFKSLIDVKNIVTVLIVFLLVLLTAIISHFISPKFEDAIKLTDDYDSLTNKYKTFSNLFVYKNNKESSYELGRKKTSSKADSFDNDEDRYTFPTVMLSELKGRNVSINFDFNDHSHDFKQPSWVEKHRDELFKAHNKSEIYNQHNLRLYKYDDNKDGVTLYLSKTTYYESLITNRACDYEIDGVSVREIYEPGPYLNDLDDSKLSNHLGFNGMVETSDGKFIFIKRHKRNSIAKDTWQTSIGASLKMKYALNKDKTVNIESVSNAIIEEIMAEFNLNKLEDKNKIKDDIRNSFSFKRHVWYLYRDLLECGKPQLMFYYRLPIDSNRVLEAFNTGNKKDKKNKDRFGYYCSVDGHKMMFIDKDELNKLYLCPDGFAYKDKFYNSVPSVVATIGMLIGHSK